jgi:hypothetical protein
MPTNQDETGRREKKNIRAKQPHNKLFFFTTHDKLLSILCNDYVNLVQALSTVEPIKC